MNNDKRPLVIECATALFAVLLWETTINFLGVSSTMPPGLKAKVGSMIVLTGCFVIARPVVSITALLFRSKSAPPVTPRTKVTPEIETTAGSPARTRSALFRRNTSPSRLNPPQ